MTRLPWVRRATYDRMVDVGAAKLARLKAEHTAELATLRHHAARGLEAAQRVADLEIDLAIARHALHEADAAGPTPTVAAAFARRHEQLAGQVRQLTADNSQLRALAAGQEDRLAAAEGRPVEAGAL